VPASTGLAGTLLVVIAGVGAMRAEASRFEGAMRRGGAAQPPGSRP
jgi:hypothetical protein